MAQEKKLIGKIYSLKILETGDLKVECDGDFVIFGEEYKEMSVLDLLHEFEETLRYKEYLELKNERGIENSQESVL